MPQSDISGNQPDNSDRVAPKCGVGPGDRSLAVFRAELETIHRNNTLKRLCFGFLQNDQDAQDAAQEVFVKALEGLGSYRGEASLTTWLYQIARNQCRNILTRGRPALSWDALVASGAEPCAPSAEIEKIERSLLGDQLWASVEAKAKTRKPPWDLWDYLIYEAYYTDAHKTWDEMASLLGKNKDTLKYHFYQHVLPTLQEVGTELKIEFNG